MHLFGLHRASIPRFFAGFVRPHQSAKHLRPEVGLNRSELRFRHDLSPFDRQLGESRKLQMQWKKRSRVRPCVLLSGSVLNNKGSFHPHCLILYNHHQFIRRMIQSIEGWKRSDDMSLTIQTWCGLGGMPRTKWWTSEFARPGIPGSLEMDDLVDTPDRPAN